MTRGRIAALMKLEGEKKREDKKHQYNKDVHAFFEKTEILLFFIVFNV